MADDDLVPLFGPPPVGPSLDMRYRQGRVVTFDPVTLQNTVDVGGSILTNLPILGVGEATLLVPGANVGITCVQSLRGTATWAIIGRWVEPNTADAQDAISLLSSWVAADSVAIQESLSTYGFTDLATPGPTVTINVRGTGRVLVTLSCQMQQIDVDPGDGMGGFVSFEMSGANVMSAGTAALTLVPSWFIATPGSVGMTVTSQVTACGQAVFSGLNAGPTTFTAKYSSQVAGENCDFGRRSLVVISL